ncbi:hypothetical protein BGZ57DRAFT_921671 [Hyaloscypha finlandica]|nr:hypothetical protein BGZ57DRAFT_921671 [Hyaloscypha finlandica]
MIYRHLSWFTPSFQRPHLPLPSSSGKKKRGPPPVDDDPDDEDPRTPSRSERQHAAAPA